MIFGELGEPAIPCEIHAGIADVQPVEAVALNDGD